MPIYMDRHNIPGVTAQHVAEAHQADLKVQGKFNCKVLTYWFDEQTGAAFCLVDAPQKKSVIDMHNNAHGLVPHKIIEVNQSLVKSFLGRITDPENIKTSDAFIKTLNETGFRTILNIGLKAPALFLTKSQKRKESTYEEICNKIIRRAFNKNKGSEIKDRYDGIIASFMSVYNACICAFQIQEGFKLHNKNNSRFKIHAAAGLSTGAPVTERDGLFEDTIKLAERLTYIAGNEEVLFSSTVSEILERKKISVPISKKLFKTLKPAEENFLNKLMDILEMKWNDTKTNTNSLARHLGVSRAQLYRKINAITGYSPNEFIKDFRLGKALKLIQKQYGNISEISFESGFSSPSYFTRCFQNKYGFLPSEYIKMVA